VSSIPDVLIGGGRQR